MKRVNLLVAAACLLGACASYRYVHRTQTGGTIALKGPYEDAMAKARGAMEQHCQGPYTIVEEGEAVIGEDTVAQGRRTHTGSSTTGSAESSTRNATEWRVTYVCGVQAPAPTAAPATPVNPPPAPAPTPPPPAPSNY